MTCMVLVLFPIGDLLMRGGGMGTDRVRSIFAEECMSSGLTDCMGKFEILGTTSATHWRSARSVGSDL